MKVVGRWRGRGEDRREREERRGRKLKERDGVYWGGGGSVVKKPL